MKTLWLYTVKNYIRIGLFFYFKSIKTNDLDKIPFGKPLMILSNHQNALLDALLIATRIKGTAFFLTRASVFKKKMISDLLKSLQLLPIYRIRDGFSNLNKNEGLFDNISDKLKESNSVVIFPEGNHDLARRVRPLSKGFTRIVFNTLKKHPDLDLKLQPIGLNYDRPKELGSRASIFCGSPIDAQDYIPSDFANSTFETNSLKRDMQDAIGKLTTNIPVDDYDAILKKLDEMNVDYMNPTSVNQCIENDLSDCPYSKGNKNLLFNKFFKLLLIPFVLLPYLIWKYYIEPKIEEQEFLATFRFGVVITLVPIYVIVISLVLLSFFGIKSMLLYLAFTILLALLTVKT